MRVLYIFFKTLSMPRHLPHQTNAKYNSAKEVATILEKVFFPKTKMLE